MNKIFDKYYPLTCSFIGVFLCFIIFPAYQIDGNIFIFIFIISTLTNLIAIYFLSVARMELLLTNGSKAINWLKDAGAYDVFINYFDEAISANAFCVGYSVVPFLFFLNNYIEKFPYYIWLFLIIYALILSLRCFSVLFRIVLATVLNR